MLPITSLYASLLAFFYFWLSFNVIRLRMRTQISLGDGGDETLRRASRAHGNFIEYVPFVLILMILAEMHQASALIVHAMGLLLIAGRAIHAYSLLKAEVKTGSIRFRVIGQMMTFGALLIGAFYGLYVAALASGQ